ncbi:MAG: hypothetical protein ACREPM_19410 [Gemmatimonadaceae bacterium]
MTTVIGERPAPPATYGPPRDATGDVLDWRDEQSIARRLVERFALIAFGLYHLPLFLNNYPSLGGGGVNDSGLAIKWGHVFTPVGVWVARLVFHMNGPMPAASGGDNGDVGEEFGRLLASVVIAVIGAVCWTIADRKRPAARWTGEALRVLLRYSIALGIASYAIAKILPVQFPPLTTAAYETRLGDLTPMSLLWSFMEYSRPYAFFGGLMELTAVLLLCFRRTATLGAAVCLAVMTNVALMNLAYGVPVKLYALMVAVSAAALLVYEAPRLVRVFVTNQPAPAARLSSALDRIPLAARWTIKVLLVGSVILSSAVTMVPAARARAWVASPLDGAWVVTSFARNGVPLDSTGNPARWRRVVIDAFTVGVRFETDTVVRCRRTSTATTLSLLCVRNHRGELTWTRTGDVLRVEGTFDGAPIVALAKYVDPSNYPLVRSKFRWIFDR